jgi:dihydrofolate synthase/folylpolyglutamate synthase
MTYKQTLAYLYGLQARGMKFGLRNIRALAKFCGNPHTQFHSLHVAGTNGKGSTCAFMASIFTESGYKTGLYTSPHLVRFTERIRINGVEIPEKRLVEYVRRLRPMIEKRHATFFEATTCIAFQYFANERVDIAIIETGLGGRLDSTNIIAPLVSVITNVALDHQKYLGKTIAKIAEEKAGIIKSGVPCVTSSDDEEVLDLLHSVAQTKGAEVFEARRYEIKEVKLGLAGEHQERNAVLAGIAVGLVMSNYSLFAHLSNATARRGLMRVRRNTGIRGRFERVGKRFILDVAHNPDGIETLIESLSPATCRNLTVVFGVMKDKDYAAMIEPLAKIATRFIAVAPRMERALPSKEVALLARGSGEHVVNGGTVARGVRLARLSKSRGKILVTGSNYVVGEALAVLERKRR